MGGPGGPGQSLCWAEALLVGLGSGHGEACLKWQKPSSHRGPDLGFWAFPNRPSIPKGLECPWLPGNRAHDLCFLSTLSPPVHQGHPSSSFLEVGIGAWGSEVTGKSHHPARKGTAISSQWGQGDPVTRRSCPKPLALSSNQLWDGFSFGYSNCQTPTMCQAPCQVQG